MPKEPSIRLHPEKGLAPHLTACPNCGKEGNEIVLLGIKNYKVTCNNCGLVGYGGFDGGKCPKCQSHDISKRQELEDYDRVPLVCEACTKLQEQCDELVKNGGIYWKCSKCHSSGAIAPKAELSIAVRKHMNVPTGPCGVTLTEKECPACQSRKPVEEGGGDGGKS